MPTGGYERIPWTCPWCGKVMKAYYSYHMEMWHGLTLEESYLKEHGLSKAPECPMCGKPRGFRGFTYIETCGSYECRNRLVNERSMDSGANAFLNISKEDHIKRGLDEQKKRKEQGLPAYLGISEESYEKRKLTNKLNGTYKPSDTKPGYLYIFKFWEENLCKIGQTRNLNKRLDDYEFSGVYPDEVDYVKLTDKVTRELETLTHQKFSQFYKPLSDKFSPVNSFRRLGKTEFYDIKIYNDVIEFWKTELNLTVIEYPN